MKRPRSAHAIWLEACYRCLEDRQELKRLWRCDTLYAPHMETQERVRLLDGWNKAVSRSLDWAPHN